MTAPLLATRAALAAELHRLDHGDWISGTPRTPWGTSREAGRRDEYLARADALFASGVVRDPATIADDETLIEAVYRGRCARHTARSVLRALAAVLKEDPS